MSENNSPPRKRPRKVDAGEPLSTFDDNNQSDADKQPNDEPDNEMNVASPIVLDDSSFEVTAELGEQAAEDSETKEHEDAQPTLKQVEEPNRKQGNGTFHGEEEDLDVLIPVRQSTPVPLPDPVRPQATTGNESVADLGVSGEIFTSEEQFSARQPDPQQPQTTETPTQQLIGAEALVAHYEEAGKTEAPGESEKSNETIVLSDSSSEAAYEAHEVDHRVSSSNNSTIELSDSSFETSDEPQVGGYETGGSDEADIRELESDADQRGGHLYNGGEQPDTTYTLSDDSDEEQ